MKNKENELYISRLYEAPVKLVWDAWCDPTQAAQWWGPRGFTITTHSKDFRKGGVWHYTMHGPDGTDYPNKTKYLEIEKHSLLVYDHGGYDDRPPLFRVTVRFSELPGNKTRMEMVMALPTADAAKETKKFIKKANGNSTWDRLAEYLSDQTDGVDRFVINRSFETPLENLFEMWSNPEHFSRWLPPTGFTMKFLRKDVRAGGTSFYSMTDGKITIHGTVSYREIRRPDRLVYTQQFRDEKENISRHPLAPTWPQSMLTTVTLTAEGPNCSRATVVWEVDGEATAEERATFRQAKGGMNQGWAGSFDKLDDYLGK